MKQKGLIMLVSGTGGAGKNTIINGLLGRGDFKFISSYTTREKRETDNKDQYQFITKAKFEQKIKTGEVFEYDMFNNCYYGTSKKLFLDGLNEASVVIKDISVAGYKNIAEEFDSVVNIASVFLTESKKVLKQRLIYRGEDKQKIKNRLSLYKSEQAQIPNYNFVIKNDVYLKTLDKIMAIKDLSFGKKMLLPTKNFTKISAKKIDKYAFKLAKGKHIREVAISLHNNNVYIVDGLHRYLAGLKANKNVAMRFVDFAPRSAEVDLNEWKKIVNCYK